jgi:purine-binding chemotaxis protein CheW
MSAWVETLDPVDRPLNMTTDTQESGNSRIEQLVGKYLTFVLQGQSCGIEVLKIREIIRMTAITAVPQMPPYVRGVINLRGKIIPVIDLRLRFGFAEAKNTEQTCIVVVLVKLSERKTTQMGMIVDGVEEVAQVAAVDLEEAPDFGAGNSTQGLLGLAKLKSGVKTLLDIDQIIGGQQGVQLVDSAAQESTVTCKS